MKYDLSSAHNVRMDECLSGESDSERERDGEYGSDSKTWNVEVEVSGCVSDSGRERERVTVVV